MIATHEPESIADVEELEERLSRPDDDVVADLAALDGDILVLGAGGKMGPTLARMAKRAAPDKTVTAVARFSAHGLEEGLRAHGVETVRADLLERSEIDRLPRAANVVFMAGQKFGTSGAPSQTWAMNTLLPAYVAEAMAGKPDRGVLHRLRLRVRTCRLGRRDRGDAPHAAGRVRGELRRPGAHPPVALGAAWNPRPAVPAQLRDRPALRRPARRRPAGP